MNSAKRIQLVASGDMSSNVTSTILPLDQIFGLSIQADYSGSPSGTLSLQGSVDHDQDFQGNVRVPGTFVSIAGSDVTITGAGSWVWNLTSSMYPYLQLVYTATSGSGTLNAFASVKGV